MDVDKLSTGEKIAGVSAVLLFIFMFFDWFGVEVSGAAGLHRRPAPVAAPGTRSTSSRSSSLITIVAAIGVAALRLSDSDFEPPVSINAVVAVLGGLSVLLILFRIVDPPGSAASRRRLGRRQPRRSASSSA